MFTLKSYGRNRNYPKRLITEGYIANECITHYSRYFEGVETRFNQLAWNDDTIELTPMLDAPLPLILGNPVGRVENVIFYDQTLIKAR